MTMSVVDPGQVKLAIEKEGKFPQLTTFDQVRDIKSIQCFIFNHCKICIFISLFT